MQQMKSKTCSSQWRGSPNQLNQKRRTWQLESLEDRLAPVTAIWIATTAGSWSNPANWSTGAVPQNTDVAIFSTGLGGSASNVTVDNSVTVGSIQCDFTFSGGMLIDAGISLTAGSFNHYGTLALRTNSTLTVNGTFLEYGTLNVSANNVVINAGQMQIISGGVPTSNGSLSLIATAPTSTPNLTINGALIAAGPMTIGDGGTAAWMHVNGTLEIQGPAPTVINLKEGLVGP